MGRRSSGGTQREVHAGLGPRERGARRAVSRATRRWRSSPVRRLQPPMVGVADHGYRLAVDPADNWETPQSLARELEWMLGEPLGSDSFHMVPDDRGVWWWG